MRSVVRLAHLVSLVSLVSLRSAAVFVVVTLALAGCDLGPGPMPVRKVLVDVEPQASGLDREEVRATVQKFLNGARGIQIVDGGRDEAAVLRVRVDGYGTEPGSASEGKVPRTTLALTLELTGVPGEPSPDGFRGHSVASGTGDIDARGLVEQALRDALGQVLMTRGASDLKTEQLVAWLTGEDSSDEQKRRAIRVLGSRRERAAVEPLARVLTDGDAELQPLALAALTNIGDPAGVEAVIEYSDRQPPIVKKQCIEAVRSMGSPRGRAWLFTLSTGHPDVDVQQQATAALASLEGASGGGDAVAEKTEKTPPVEAVR